MERSDRVNKHHLSPKRAGAAENRRVMCFFRPGSDAVMNRKGMPFIAYMSGRTIGNLGGNAEPFVPILGMKGLFYFKEDKR